MIPRVLPDQARKRLAQAAARLTEAHVRREDTRLDLDADEIDHHRACESLDDAERAMVTEMRRSLPGPEDPGAWGGAYRGHRAVILRGVAFVLVEGEPDVGLEGPTIIRLPGAAIWFDDATHDDDLVGLRDALDADAD